MKEECINIPCTSVEELITCLKGLYGGAIRNGIKLDSVLAAFLWGPPGIGKSQAIAGLAEEIGEEYKVNVKVTDVHLLLYSPIDLRGVPVADEERRFTNWLMPRIFDMNCDRNTVNILFLDELSAAPQSVQAAAYQICLDRKIGEHVLPENCIVVAAGNRTTDQSVSYKMPKALCNRLMHFNVRSDFGSWRKWAVRRGISDKIIAYLGFDSTRLYVEPGASDLAYPTPRSWEFVSTLLSVHDAEPENIHSLIAACVGNDTALEFEAFCKGYLKMPSITEILEGRCTEYPKQHDVMYALISALTATVRDQREVMTTERLDNVFDYIKRLPNDFVMSFIKDILEINGMNEKMMKCYGFQNWISKHKNIM